VGLVRMRMLDELHLQNPFMGMRRLRDELAKRGHPINRKTVGGFSA